MTNIETKALCSLFRKTEAESTEALVDLMIDLCDAQSGLLMQDLWKWWQEHKLSDAEKLKTAHEKWQEYTKEHEHTVVKCDPYVYDPLRSQFVPTIWPGNGKVEIIC